MRVNNQSDAPGLFNGVYSYQEAARLLNITSRRAARWADGYVRRVKYGYRFSAPVLQSDRNKGVLSFNELFELFFVREYVRLGVKLEHVRTMAEALAKDFGAYPFASARLIVNGSELIRANAQNVLHRPDVGQLVADFAVSFSKNVDFREERAGRINPIGFEKRVYLDKDTRSGEAVVSQHAIPTRSVYALWMKEQNLESVADYHDIDLADVSAAVRYEGEWQLAA